MALKHYTSKLATYSDLTTLETFGFRGEALSSLCALSTFTVSTCVAADVPKGSKLEYETSGKLRSTGVVAAQKGTTISVEHLFKNLPVRRRELERNIKREWNRVITVLNQYACIQTGVKFSVSQQPTKGKRITLFSTKGNKTTRENIVNVFGAKTLTVLIPLELKLELEPTKTPLHLRTVSGPTTDTTEILVRGHVSRPAHGEGRQTPDRQMFFVNGRPCGLPQFAKVFNEVYKAYNASQSPFIFADIQLDTHLYDVNVSPDKRTILLHDQPRMLDNLRAALTELFEGQDYAVPSSTLLAGKQTPYKKPSIVRHDTISSFRSDRSRVATVDKPDDEHDASKGAVGNDDSENEDKEVPVNETPSAQRTQAFSISQWARGTPDIATASTIDGTENDEEENVQLSGGDRTLTPTRNHEDDAFGQPNVDVDHDSNEDGEYTDAISTSDIPVIQSRPPESPIPAVAAPTHTAGLSSSQAVSSFRAKRPAPELATITIGGSTVTSMLGAPPKRTKTIAGSSSMPTRSKAKSNVPSFQGRLVEMFAASTQKSQDAGSAHGLPRSAQDKDDNVSDAESEQLFVHDDGDVVMSGHEDEEVDVEADEAMMDGARLLADSAMDESENQSSRSDSPAVEAQDKDDRVNPSDEEDDDEAEQVHSAPGSEYGGEEEEDEAEHEEGPRQELEEEPDDQPSEEALKRTQAFMKASIRKHTTHHLQQTLRTDDSAIQKILQHTASSLSDSTSTPLGRGDVPTAGKLDADDAEAKLSLTISKIDFLDMKIIGQFNLGFIIAVREAKDRAAMGSTSTSPASTTTARDDELFIIDQHATDEKYNFERLQASTVVQSQRLVQPKQLDLTALEEEVIKENIPALEANGFQVDIDESGFHPVGQRVKLVSLPLSRETTFDLADLEELVSLLTDHHEVSASAFDLTPAAAAAASSLSGSGGTTPITAAAQMIPRPSKVRKMFAMRACRSSVMIGKPLTTRQMEKLVRHMGELDKPWNCPHGRPTMRHLCGLAGWDKLGWTEEGGTHFDDGQRQGGGGGEQSGNATRIDWAAYLRD